jgi:uroporphyrinogen decarboxylase
MTHRDRVLATFRFEQTDRLACDLMEGVVWPELMDHFRATRGLDDAAQVLDFLDTDFRWLFMQYINPEPQAAPPEPAPVPDHRLYSQPVAHGPLAGATSVADVLAYPFPDPSAWQPPDFAVARAQFPDHALAFSAGWQPLFWGACDAFGVEDALIKLLLDPPIFEAFVRRRHEFYMDLLARALHAARGLIDICWLGDDFSSQQSMFLSPDHWRRFIKPYLAEQVALARAHDLLVLYHSCGAVRPVLGDLLDIGVNGMLVFQTTAAGMDPESIARDFGGRMVFYGGMDVQQLLSFGTPEDVAIEVDRNARAFAPYGGYVVANSHHCVATIRGENIEAMFRAAHHWP